MAAFFRLSFSASISAFYCRWVTTQVARAQGSGEWIQGSGFKVQSLGVGGQRGALAPWQQVHRYACGGGRRREHGGEVSVEASEVSPISHTQGALTQRSSGGAPEDSGTAAVVQPNS